jgi:hypothetical protein
VRPSQAGLYMLPLLIVVQLTELQNCSRWDAVAINSECPNGRSWGVGCVWSW